MRILLTVVLLLAAIACFAITDDDVDEWVDGNNRFGLEILRQLSMKSPQDNLCFSPISAYMCFAMLYMGAVDEGKDELRDAFHYELDEPELHEVSRVMLERYRQTVYGGGVFELTNSAWLNLGYSIQVTFQNDVERYYGAHLDHCDFSGSPEAERERINDWCAEVTRDNIKRLLPRGFIDRKTELLLINAAYLFQYWSRQFDIDDTQYEVFYLDNNLTDFVDMMHAVLPADYAITDDYEIVSLPYRDRRFAMAFVLPVDGVNIHELAGKLYKRKADEILPDRTMRTQVDVAIPRFKVRNFTDMKPLLTDRGVRLIFQDGWLRDISGGANFSLRKAIQSASIEVGEKGTEAAATTAAEHFDPDSIDPPPLRAFRADRPFLFLLHDVETGAILFLGKVMHPGEKRRGRK